MFYLFVCEGIDVLVVWAEEQISVDGTPLAHHPILIQHGRMVDRIHQDLKHTGQDRDVITLTVHSQDTHSTLTGRITHNRNQHYSQRTGHSHRYSATQPRLWYVLRKVQTGQK